MHVFLGLRNAVVAAGLVAVFSESSSAITFTPLNFPGAAYTGVASIDGANVVGFYEAVGGGQHGFLYDGTNWTTLDVPFLTGYDTRAFGISGDRIVGWYLAGPHGFLKDGDTWTELDSPGSLQSSNQAVDGANIVGLGGSGGFLYDGATWTTLAYPGSAFTNPLGIDGDKIVGFYQIGDFDAPRHGFVRDGGAWQTLDYPGSLTSEAWGVDGDSIVGTWWDSSQSHGFLYDGTTWQSFDYPGSMGTSPTDISGNRIVGLYYDATGYSHSFLATIPEPTAAVLIGVGLAVIFQGRFHRLRTS